MALSRRGFLKYCTLSAAAPGLGPGTLRSLEAVDSAGPMAYVFDSRAGLQVVFASGFGDPSVLGTCEELEFGRAGGLVILRLPVTPVPAFIVR